MSVRRAGVVSSALATALLGTFLYRAGPTLRPSPELETSRSQAALPQTTEPSKKRATQNPHRQLRPTKMEQPRAKAHG